jgi:hypothetical protein
VGGFPGEGNGRRRGRGWGIPGHVCNEPADRGASPPLTGRGFWGPGGVALPRAERYAGCLSTKAQHRSQGTRATPSRRRPGPAVGLTPEGGCAGRRDGADAPPREMPAFRGQPDSPAHGGAAARGTALAPGPVGAGRRARPHQAPPSAPPRPSNLEAVNDAGPVRRDTGSYSHGPCSPREPAPHGPAVGMGPGWLPGPLKLLPACRR